ncbi:unnamed protein product [Ceutorhynchus assimilis]|uniref:BRCT domain-containing protein n=1 Tax=Ceutorhynchus assimilis TaxID=467358 RepID=A0A9N9MHZ3_9CUCU|nr:unnamed protein product [Ceutorhynchus assimilis]
MANIRVTFVLPNNARDESEASHVMKQAYNSCKNFVNEIFWAKETDLNSRDLSKGDYLVFEEFSNKDYTQYTERKCVVISPLAISVCLVEGKQIPKFNWPILSVALYGCEVTCTQLPKNLKESIKEKVQLMGGSYSGDLTNSVTHLICGSSNSEKYRLAVEKGVLLMLPTWIDYMFELSQKNNVNCHNKKILDEYKCPPFYGLSICATGLTSGPQKTRLSEVIKTNGGSFTGTLILSKTDVLICYGTTSSTSEKYKSARRVPSIWCVTPNWIDDSVEKEKSIYNREKVDLELREIITMCNNRLIFEQLNKIIDDCALHLSDEETRFKLQLEYDKELLGKNLKQEERIAHMPSQISNLKRLQNEIQTQTALIERTLQDVEQVLIDVEQKIPPQCTCQRKPTNKEETYLLIEDISAKLINRQQQIEEAQACDELLAQINPDVESIAQIMIRSLQNLESIELKIGKMKEKLNEVEFYKQACYHKYKKVGRKLTKF